MAADGTRVRQLILDRAQTDLSRCVVALARRYDLSVTELSSLLIRELAEANKIGLDHEQQLDMEAEPK